MEHRATTVYKTALLAGVILGGTLGLLYAPRKGSELRQILCGKVESVRKASWYPSLNIAGRNDEERRARKLAALHMQSKKGEELQNKLVTMGFITGALIGGIVGLLYAPRPGKETRDMLMSKAEYTAEEAKVLAEHAREIALEKARKARAAAAAAISAAEKHEADAASAEEAQG